jgi:hypothetical protein
MRDHGGSAKLWALWILLISGFLREWKGEDMGFIMHTNWPNNCIHWVKGRPQGLWAKQPKDLVEGIWNLDNWESEYLVIWFCNWPGGHPKKKANAKHTHFQSKLSIRKGKVVF